MYEGWKSGEASPFRTAAAQDVIDAALETAIAQETQERNTMGMSLSMQIDGKAPANAALTATSETGTDTSTGAVASEPVGNVLQKIWNKIRQVANALNSVTKSQVGLGSVTNDAQVKAAEKGAANGVATLNGSGKVPSGQLPDAVTGGERNVIRVVTGNLPTFVNAFDEAVNGEILIWAGDEASVILNNNNYSTALKNGGMYQKSNNSDLLEIGCIDGEAATLKYSPTFIVNSDAALADWANNASGKDYSRVLIKAGTWTYNDPRTSGGGQQQPVSRD